MSGMTADDARNIVMPMVKRIREETYGAKKWDENGIWAELVRCQGHNLQLTIERFARHAGDPKADTPGAVRRPFLPDAPISQPAFPPKPEVACRTCGKEVGQCPCPAPKLHSAPVDHEAYDRGAGMARALLDEKRGVPHNHTEPVEGCFRCELSADETAASRAAHPTHTDTESE